MILGFFFIGISVGGFIAIAIQHDQWIELKKWQQQKYNSNQDQE